MVPAVLLPLVLVSVNQVATGPYQRGAVIRERTVPRPCVQPLVCIQRHGPLCAKQTLEELNDILPGRAFDQPTRVPSGRCHLPLYNSDDYEPVLLFPHRSSPSFDVACQAGHSTNDQTSITSRQSAAVHLSSNLLSHQSYYTLGSGVPAPRDIAGAVPSRWS